MALRFVGADVGMTISSYHDLRVWQAGMQLAADIHQLTQAFPAAEPANLAAEMQRAAIAIPSNIADGHTRGSTAEYLDRVAVAHGSLAELQTHIEIARRFGYISSASATALSDQTNSLSRQLSALRVGLTNRIKASSPSASARVP
jgi:four helix bundle protein